MNTTTFLTEFDLFLIGEGSHERAYEKMGAHVTSLDDQPGVHFAVWAPNARQVSLVGDFNGWQGDSHYLHSSDSGIWSLFVPGLAEYTVYK